MNEFNIIQTLLAAGMAILGLTAMIAGLITGAWHLYAIAIASFIIVFGMMDEPFNNQKK